MDGRTVTLIEAMPLCIACSGIVISCRRWMQIVTSVTKSSQPVSPILRRCLARGSPECAGEIGLARKPEPEGDIDQGPVRIAEQILGAFEAPCTDMPMRRFADGGLERAREIKLAQAGNRGQPRYRQIALQIGFDIVEHPRQSASVEPFPCGRHD